MSLFARALVRTKIRIGALVLSGLFAGCGGGLAHTNFATSQDRAAHQERTSCSDAASELDTRLLTPGIVQSAEPLYAVVQTKHGIERRLMGAQLRVPAQPGLTAEWLERTLKCHGARRTLSAEQSPAASPYFLPNGWVEIAVETNGDGFNVHLRGEDREASQQILDRAKAFTVAIGG